MAEADAGPELALRKLTQTFGVTGYVILNRNGIPVQHHGMEEYRAVMMAAIFSELILAAQNFIEKNRKHIDSQMTDAESELTCLRLRTFKNEIIVCPEDGYTLIVQHNPNYVQPAVKAEASGEGEEGGPAAAGSRPGTAAV